MNRKDFFKNCAKYIGGAVAAVTVGKHESKAQEIQGVISEVKPITLEKLPWPELQADLLHDKGIRIHGVPKNSHVSIRYHEDCAEVITQDLNFSKESFKSVRVYGLDKDAIVTDIRSDYANNTIDVMFELPNVK